MSYLIQKDIGQLSFAGGGIVKAHQVSDTGVYSTGSNYDFGYIKESTWKDVQNLETYVDETKQPITYIEGNREVRQTFNLSQENVDILNFPNAVRGNKFFRVYKYHGIKDGQHIETITAIGKLVPSIDKKYPDSDITVEYVGINNSGSVVVDSSEMTIFGAHYTASVTIPAGYIYLAVSSSAS